MPKTTLNIALVSLFAIFTTGCASQNAMTMLPDDVRLSIAAEQARQAEAEPVQKPVSTAALSDEEIAFRTREMAHARQVEPAAAQEDEAEPAEDPKALFARALEMKRKPVEAQYTPEAETVTADAETVAAYAEEAAPAAEDVWTTVQAMRKASVEDDPVGFADSIRTAAVAAGADGKLGEDDYLDLAMDPSTGAIDQDAQIRIRLLGKGGRIARRIVVGRLDGEGFEVLQAARQHAETISGLTGGEPGISYDPAVLRGTVRIEYEPRA